MPLHCTYLHPWSSLAVRFVRPEVVTVTRHAKTRSSRQSARSSQQLNHTSREAWQNHSSRLHAATAWTISSCLIYDSRECANDAALHRMPNVNGSGRTGAVAGSTSLQAVNAHLGEAPSIGSQGLLARPCGTAYAGPLTSAFGSMLVN